MSHVMLYNICYVILYNKCHGMLYNIGHVMLSTCVMFCYNIKYVFIT